MIPHAAHAKLVYLVKLSIEKKITSCNLPDNHSQQDMYSMRGSQAR